MDGLIVLLIIIGVVTSISKSSKKKKAAEAQRKAEKPAPAQPKAGAVKIPYTREEWAEFLKREPESRGWPREKEEDATCCPPSPAGAPGSFPRTGRSPRSGSEKRC